MMKCEIPLRYLCQCVYVCVCDVMLNILIQNMTCFNTQALFTNTSRRFNNFKESFCEKTQQVKRFNILLKNMIHSNIL